MSIEALDTPIVATVRQYEHIFDGCSATIIGVDTARKFSRETMVRCNITCSGLTEAIDMRLSILARHEEIVKSLLEEVPYEERQKTQSSTAEDAGILIPALA